MTYSFLSPSLLTSLIQNLNVTASPLILLKNATSTSRRLVTTTLHHRLLLSINPRHLVLDHDLWSLNWLLRLQRLLEQGRGLDLAVARFPCVCRHFVRVVDDVDLVFHDDFGAVHVHRLVLALITWTFITLGDCILILAWRIPVLINGIRSYILLITTESLCHRKLIIRLFNIRSTPHFVNSIQHRVNMLYRPCLLHKFLIIVLLPQHRAITPLRMVIKIRISKVCRIFSSCLHTRLRQLLLQLY